MDLKERLKDLLAPGELRSVPKSYDIVGDIAVLRVPATLDHRKKLIAEAVMHVDRHVKTVLNQIGPVSGDFRLRGLEHLLGEEKTETVHRETGCVFKVDLKECYFSPRLSYERMRVARLIKPGEVVLNMFAGVGSFSIIIAKNARPRRVYSIDINPVAVRYHRENVKINKVEHLVDIIEGDAKKLIEGRLRGVADRVLMPLPEKAHEHIEPARLALKPEGGWIHYQGFEHAGTEEDPIKKAWERVAKELLRLGFDFEVPHSRIVRDVGPRWYQIVLDILIND